MTRPKKRSSTVRRKFLGKQGYKKTPRGKEVAHRKALVLGEKDDPRNLMLKKKSTHKKDIEKIYKGYCNETDIRFKRKEFEDFIKFLEIDFYDWVKENLRCYFRGKKPIG